MTDRDLVKLPKSLDELADLLIDDLELENQTTLAFVDDETIYEICDAIRGNFLDEFQLFSGNDKLLMSIVSADYFDESQDLVEVVVRRMIDKLRDPIYL